MSKFNRCFALFILLAVALIASLGCDSGSDASAVSSDSFILKTKPANHTTIGVAQAGIAPGETTPDETTPDETTPDETTPDEIESNQNEIVIKGWVDLKAFEAKKNSAVFMLREILDDGHGGDGHDPSSCPFCKRRMNAAPKAAIAFRDKNHKVIKQDANKLIPLEHGDTVFVKGHGTFDKEFNGLKVTASGIYLAGDKQF